MQLALINCSHILHCWDKLSQRRPIFLSADSVNVKLNKPLDFCRLVNCAVFVAALCFLLIMWLLMTESTSEIQLQRRCHKNAYLDQISNEIWQDHSSFCQKTFVFSYAAHGRSSCRIMSFMIAWSFLLLLCDMLKNFIICTRNYYCDNKRHLPRRFKLY